MLFKRKGSLKKKYDLKLLSEMEELKKKWEDDKSILARSFDLNEDLNLQVKLAELKYFYLFKEAKERNLRVSGKK